MRKGTVCFIVKENEVLLILIEYSPTNKKWTGIGGYVEEGEALEDTIVREAHEESYIELKKENLKKVAELDYEQLQLHVFLIDKWTGELRAKESSLKEFKWFPNNNLPFSEMQLDNDKWLPKILDGKLIKKVNDKYIEVKAF